VGRIELILEIKVWRKLYKLVIKYMFYVTFWKKI